MADQRITQVSEREMRFREIGRFLVTQAKTHCLRSSSLAWALNCRTHELDQLGRKEGFELGFQGLQDGDRYLFAVVSILGGEQLAPVFPSFLFDKLSTAWTDPKRNFDTLLTLADWWAFLPATERERLHPLLAVEDLMRALDFLGHHNLSTEFGRSVWPALRGVDKADVRDLSEEQKLFTELEKSNRDAMKTVLARNLSRAKAGLGLRLSTLVIAIRSFIIFFRSSISFRGARRLEIVAANMDELAHDSFHWERSTEVLASYWFDSELCVEASRKMAWGALKAPANSIRLMRALDWYFFTSAHIQNMTLITILYRALIPFAKRLAPFLLSDIRMHLGILLYYRGRCLDALLQQSYVEAALHTGNHPFNRDINLANALRSAITLRTPRFANSIFNKIHIQSLFQGGLNLQRTKLCISMQRVREDGLSVHRDHLWTVYSEIGDLPPIAKGSFEAMLAQAFLEARAFDEARKFAAAARATLNQARSAYPFEKMLDAVERGLSEAGRESSPTALEISIPARQRTLIAVNFNEPYFSQDEQSTMLHVLNILFEAESFSSLCRRFQENMRDWLPEFRYFIEHDNQTFQSDAPMPLSPEDLLRDLSGASDQVFNRNSHHEVEWTFISKFSSELNLRLLVGAPSIYRKGGGARFLLASNIANSFAQAFQQMTSRSLRRRLEHEALEKQRDATLGRLASHVAHDIRSPLSALRIATQSANTLDPVRRNLILSACERIDGIADQLLQKYREFEPDASFAIAQACEQIVTEKRVMCDGQPVVLHLESSLKDFEARARGDVNAFKSILSNLINNSLDAIQEKGRIEIGLNASHEFIIVAVRDDGRGIDKDVLETLQNGRVISTKNKGHGLGLRHAFEQISKWAGGISIQSELGRGTLVQIKLLRT